MDSLAHYSSIARTVHTSHKHFTPFYYKFVPIRASVSIREPQTLVSPTHFQVSREHSQTTITATALQRPLPNDPSLRSTWAHRAWVACGCTSVLATLVKSALAASADQGSWIECVVGGGLGYILADFGTGVYHWGIDNYGDATTPFFGGQIAAFQGHHRWPWTITKRDFANNLSALARATTFLLAPLNLLPGEAGSHAFAGIFIGCLMFSQQFHAWSHGTKSRLPPVVVALQDAGLLIPRAVHAAHHRAPYNNNYCIVSGMCNKLLDDVKFFQALEMVVFFRFGLRPRSWSETSPEWLEDVEDAPFKF